MIDRFGLTIVVSLLAWSVAGASAIAQQSSSPGVVVDVNEAIYHYLQSDREGYERAIELLTGAVEREPSNGAARLFRALSHGQIGLLERDEKLRVSDDVRYFQEARRIRQDPQHLEQIQGRMTELTAALETAELTAAERLIVQDEAQHCRGLLNISQELEEVSADELDARIHERIKTVHEAASRERNAYQAMRDDLQHLIDTWDHPEAVVHLLDVIARAKIARFDEEEAVLIKGGDVPLEEAGGTPSALRLSSADILKQVARTLEDLRGELGFDFSTEDAARTSFFLGVIHYRQAIPRRAPGEPWAPVDYRLLDKAEKIMTELADHPDIADNWRSYAALYLGMIVPFRAALESDSDKRDAVLDDALRRLDQAATLDIPVLERPLSASFGAIPRIVWRTREEIERLRAQPPSAPRARNDVQLSLFLGAHRDTNVVLLGERTDLPRDITDESDFGFALGTAIDYTVTIGDRWTLGLQGRVSQLWHCEVDAFDEQRYGGSVAIQYEAMDQEGGFGPVYLRLQYDYDYTLLGRDAFVEWHRLTPNARVLWADRRAETDVYFRYEWRDYREPLYDPRFDRDGKYFAVGAVQSFQTLDMTSRYEAMGLTPWGHKNDEYLGQDDPEFPARYLTPYVGFEYAWDSTQGDEFDLEAYVLRGGVLLPLPWGLEIDAALDFEWQEYSHGSLIDYHRRPRRDFIQRYDLGLSRTFVLRGGDPINRYFPAVDRVLMTVRAHATYTDDDSNVVDRLGQGIFSYDRAIYGMSVAFTFN